MVRKNKRKERGITLIALIVTIIVLLILAGVSIAMLTGDNGILSQTQNAKNKTEEAERNEKLDLLKQEDLINETLNGVEVVKVTDEKPGELEKEDENTLVINSIEDLVFFAYDVTNGNNYSGKTVKLGTSLDFNSTKSYVDPLRTDYGKYGYNGELKTLLTTGQGFKPIGTMFDIDISTNYFEGTFDGNKNIIYNLYQNVENQDYTIISGLFSTNNGMIKDLKLENINLNGTTNNEFLLIGVIVGRNFGAIEQCSSSGTINLVANGQKAIYTGGIVGQGLNNSNVNTIDKCASSVNINVNSSNINKLYVSGIGQAKEIKNSYFVGSINVSGEQSGERRITGIANNNQLITNCYNTGKIEVYFDNDMSDLYISGITITATNIENCYNLGEIKCTGKRIYMAGIDANAQNGEINNCYNIGILKAEGEPLVLGGVVGHANDTIINNSKWLNSEVKNAIGEEGTGVVKNNLEGLNNLEKMPKILDVVNGEGAFKEDTNNINNGYPILYWE